MNFYNKVLDKKGLKRIVSWFIENYGPTRTSLLLDDFKYIGFHYAGKAGLSLGFDDLRIPATKKLLLTGAQQQVQSCEKTYLMGRITAFERYQKLIDIWTTTSEKLKDEVIQNFEKIQGGPLASPLYMMAFSGARGNISQVRQLVGMRGLMSDSGGGIIDFPIRSNFREGLSVTEYVISCYGARKGLIDTALRTADSGYLTRRLVDVAHGIIIREIDCGSLESVSMKISDIKNLLGRVLAETVRGHLENKETEYLQSGASPQGERNPTPAHPKNKVIWRNQEISPSIALELKSLKGPKSSIQVRSPLTCLSQSVCQLCYGWNLAQGRLVSLGDAVGILAAQSIGEPGTQLTMRTFHTGGIFSTEVEDKLYSPQDGYLSIYSKIATRSQSKLVDWVGITGENIAGGGGDFARPPVNTFFRGCKIRSVHGQTAFFFFDSIQLKISLSMGGSAPRGLCPPSGPKESILELPAQSILFISPGNKIFKNKLFAEISRIKQPPEKLGERKNQEVGSIPPLPPPAWEKIEDRPTKESRSLNSKSKTLGSTEISLSGGSNPLLPLANKKVFSEIQGEVIEKRFITAESINTFKIKPAAKPSTFGPGGGGTPPVIFDPAVKPQSFAPGGSPVTFGPGGNPETGGQQKTEILQQRSSSENFSPSSKISDPLVSGFETKTHRQFIKSRLVLSGEPFVFHKNSGMMGSPKTDRSTTNSETDGRIVFGGKGQKTSALPFRRGDILFWKGKRKMFSQQTIILRDEQKPGVKPQTAGPGAKPSSFAPSLELTPNMLSKSGPFEIRQSTLLPSEMKIGSNDLNSRFSNRDLIRKKLGYSGLVLHFDHQKEKLNQKSTFQTSKFASSNTLNQVSDKSLSGIPGIGLVEPSSEVSFAPRSFSPKGLGKVFQPYVGRFWDFETKTQVKTKPQSAIASFAEGIGTDGLEFNPKDQQKFEGINKPAQIIRKRNQKLILRHVQKHLGADIQTWEKENLDETIRNQQKKFKGAEINTTPSFLSSEGPPISGELRSVGPKVSGATPGPQAPPGPLVGGGIGNSQLLSEFRYVKQRDLLFQLVLPISQSSSSSDIVQGLPKIEQLFEARTPGMSSSSKEKNKKTNTTRGLGSTEIQTQAKEPRSSGGIHQASVSGALASKVSHFTDLKSRSKPQDLRSPPSGEDQVRNQEPDRLSSLSSKTALRNLQKRLIQEIQSVYNSQGVEIADKHLEIIVRQMTSRIRILEKGQTPFFPDDIIEAAATFGNVRGPSDLRSRVKPQEQSSPPSWEVFGETPGSKITPFGGGPTVEGFAPGDSANFGSSQSKAPYLSQPEVQQSALVSKKASKSKVSPSYEWVLLGITKVALLATTESYISAASFQETKRVLMNSAVQSRVDFFEGLKENVIVGRMIPAGTGYGQEVLFQNNDSF